MSRLGAGWRALPRLWLAGALSATAFASEDSLVGSPGTVRDFMIQNVCVDRSGAALEGVSPIDGDPTCSTQRDLLPGENLPYHKHDHPAAVDRGRLQRGYQRHDSFPVATAQFGVVIE